MNTFIWTECNPTHTHTHIFMQTEIENVRRHLFITLIWLRGYNKNNRRKKRATSEVALQKKKKNTELYVLTYFLFLWIKWEQNRNIHYHFSVKKWFLEFFRFIFFFHGRRFCFNVCVFFMVSVFTSFISHLTKKDLTTPHSYVSAFVNKKKEETTNEKKELSFT